MDPNRAPERAFEVIERAFDLARSGECKTINEIRSRLKAEGYNHHLIEGRTLLLQLRTIMAEASRK
jgi:hypothetical protein